MYVYDKIYLQLIHVTGTYDRSMVRWIGIFHQPHGVQRYRRISGIQLKENHPSVDMSKASRPDMYISGY